MGNSSRCLTMFVQLCKREPGESTVRLVVVFPQKINFWFSLVSFPDPTLSGAGNETNLIWCLVIKFVVHTVHKMIY